MVESGYEKSGLVCAIGGGIRKDTAGDNTLTFTNVVDTTDHNGRANRGFSFDGTTSLINAGNNANYDIGTDSFAVEMAIKSTGNTDQIRFLLGRYTDANNYWALGIRPVTNYVELRIVIGGTIKYQRANFTITQNVPFFTTFIVGRNTNYIIVNGTSLTLSFNQITNENFNFNGDLIVGKSSLFNTHAFDTDRITLIKGKHTVSSAIKNYNYWRSH